MTNGPMTDDLHTLAPDGRDDTRGAVAGAPPARPRMPTGPDRKLSPSGGAMPLHDPIVDAPPARRPEEVPTTRIVDVDLALIDYDETMDVMDGMVARGDRGYVCAVAVHAVMVARKDREMAAALEGSALTVPDGMPLVWAINMLGGNLPNRVYGPELMKRYNRRCAERGQRVWLYGGRDQGSLAQLALNMRQENPGMQIVGGYSPPFREMTADEEERLVEQVNRDRPDVLWVGIGVPKEEKWMARMRDRLEVPVMAAVGAAFDFHSGRISQAPDWMQRHGLEWSYRIAQETRRLLPRYLYYNPAFVAAFAAQLARRRLAGS